MRRVIDVSVYQWTMDYPRILQEGYEGAFVRIGYTGYGTRRTKNVDGAFHSHIAGFKSIDMPIGIYYYSIALTPAEAVKEAEFVLEKLGDLKPDFPIFIDIEDTHDVTNKLHYPKNQAMVGKDLLADTILAFVQRIEQAGFKSGLYTYYSFAKSYINMKKIHDAGVAVWMAHYAPKLAYTSGPVVMWQYTSDGLIPGTFTKEGKPNTVDLNECYEESWFPKPEIPEIIPEKPRETIWAMLWRFLMNLCGGNR